MCDVEMLVRAWKSLASDPKIIFEELGIFKLVLTTTGKFSHIVVREEEIAAIVSKFDGIKTPCLDRASP